MSDLIKVYSYTRVSTAMQIDGYSLDAQKEKIVTAFECGYLGRLGFQAVLFTFEFWCGIMQIENFI